jgi:hypothetical protein
MQPARWLTRGSPVIVLDCRDRSGEWRSSGDGNLPKRGTLRLILRRAPTGEPSENDYDVVADDLVVGRVMKISAVEHAPWKWTITHDHYEAGMPTHGFEPTREAAMKAFAKSWGRE